MKTPSQEQQESLARLQFTKDGKMLIEFVNLALEEVSGRLMADDDPQRVRLLQGESRTLRDLKKYLTPVSS